jgi:alkylation response protein AidB-like acyl-CoA dehydrogenase
MGGHAAPYDFAPYLDALGDDWSDDAVLQAWLARHGASKTERAWLQAFGRAAATRFRDAADFVERNENLPRLAGKGRYDNDLQRVVLPGKTWEMLAEVHGSGIWSRARSDPARYVAVYLLNQNGEAGVACSLACTDGLVRVLRAHAGEDEASDAALRTALASVEDATPDEWAHGAQFVTEIQGGSDAATNAVRAVRQEPERGTDASADGSTGPDGLAPRFALHGQKWFCSNLTADWWLVTARVEGAVSERAAGDEGAAVEGAARGEGGVRSTATGAQGIGLFLVARDQPGYTVERLKDKLGTRALPTAEIRFHGATGVPVGPLDAGLRTMVSVVLVTSRIHNVVAAAGFLRRAQREARAYAAFRTAFGQRLDEMTLLRDALARLDIAADHAAAGAFATVDAWLAAQRDDATPLQRAWARVLVSVAKAVATRRLPGLVYEAMMVFGGNGIEERFTALPRLWRDAAILETWEGPYTLLLAQSLADLDRLDVAGAEAEFVAAGFGAGDETGGALARRLADVLAASDADEQTHAWRALAHDVYEAFEAHALASLSVSTPQP